ncbi:mechanosensitive ion channel [Chloroflexi bacterium TSY]|nr:mechanosensitive ion channel [Chloroflexi bacterium TSY]
MISFTWVLSLILTFQLLVGIFYLIFTPETVKKYQSRLLVPILIVVIFLGFLNQLANVRLIAEIVLTNLFNSPLTIRALFVATVGLYLWTVATNGVQDLVYSLLIRYTNLDPGGTKATLTLVRYILLLVGIGLAFSQFELDSTVIAAITGGLSVGIGFGLREILSNFISGILLLFERSLHPGDVIEVDNELSVVEEFSIRATTVRTKDNVELIIPNQTFLTSSFKTYTGTDRHVRLKMILRTDCNIEPTQVIKLIIQAAQNHPDILSEPASSVFLLEYGDNVATFQLNFWVDNPLDYERIKSELKVQLWDILSEHNVALPFPEIELHFPKQVVVASEQTPLMAPAG